MSILRRRRRPDATGQRGELYFGPGGFPLISSSFYSRPALEQALRNAASLACIDVIADAISRTPVDVLRSLRSKGDVAQAVTPTPAIMANPSTIVQSDVWRYQLGFSLATDGNAFGEITSYSAGYPTSIELIDPAEVVERKVENGIPQVKYEKRIRQLYPAGDLWHVPGRIVPPGTPFALSPVDAAAKSVGMSLSAEDFSYNFFVEGGHPTGVLKANREIDEAEAKQLKEALRYALSRGRREPLVLGNFDWQQVQTNPTDSQFLDLMRFCVEQACRIWRVPPSMVYGAISGQSVTYANVTDADLALLKHSLDGYFVRLETAFTDLLPRPQYVKFNRNAILRADVKARMETYAIKLTNKLATVNEIRRLEDEPPFPGDEFDKPGLPTAPAAPAAPAAMPEPAAMPVGAMNGNGNGSAQ